MNGLFNYQKDGVSWLESRKRAGLFDEMGLGKTPQAIFAANNLKLSQILVICPAVAKYNWQNEWKKFVNRDSFVVESRPPENLKDIVICSYSNATDYLETYKRKKWDLIIGDEWHFLKEPTAQRTKAILGNRGLIHCTERIWGLTGTPAPNHAGELWTTLYTFGLTSLSYDGFISRYCNCFQEGRYGRVQITGTNTKNAPELKSLLKQFGLRRKKKDVLKDLPPVSHQTFYVKPSSDDDFPPDFMAKLRHELEVIKEKIGVDLKAIDDDKLLPALEFLSQSISSLRRYHGLKKVKPTANLIRLEFETKAYDKLVVFGVHSDVIKRLKASLYPQDNSVMIIGETPPEDRQAAVERFQNDPDCRLFFGNIQAAGTAITLTAASQGLFIEQDWTPGNNAQAADRLHRIGQKNAVSIRYVAIKDSLDAKITATLVRKVKELSTFID